MVKSCKVLNVHRGIEQKTSRHRSVYGTVRQGLRRHQRHHPNVEPNKTCTAAADAVCESTDLTPPNALRFTTPHLCTFAHALLLLLHGFVSRQQHGMTDVDVCTCTPAIRSCCWRTRAQAGLALAGTRSWSSIPPTPQAPSPGRETQVHIKKKNTQAGRSHFRNWQLRNW